VLGGIQILRMHWRCHYVRHFTGRASAEAWTARRPGTFVIGLADAATLARRHAARFFGIGAS
jgi:hypothetical protein